jgi:hypothetical protein
MANLSKTTRDHEEIRRWTEERGGKPAHVRNTGSGEDIGILRIDFPGYGGEGSLEPISWEDFFNKFDERGLALVYQEETAGGQKSNFNKLVSAETAAASEAGGRQGRSRASRSKSRGAGGASKKSAASTSRSGARAKKPTKTSSKKAASKKVSPRKAAAKKSSKAAAGKRGSATKKSSGTRSAAKKGAAKRRR